MFDLSAPKHPKIEIMKMKVPMQMTIAGTDSVSSSLAKIDRSSVTFASDRLP